jgi:tetratricopeptide (TPR) repeat protein
MNEQDMRAWEEQVRDHEATVRQEARMDAAMELITKLQYAEAEALLEEAAGGDIRQESLSGAAARSARPEVLFWLAFCREKQGDLEAAVETYEAVRAAGPGTRYARQARTRRRRLVERLEPQDQ